MFTDALLSSSWWAMPVVALLLLYWRLLGGHLDARIFLALNFSLITVWTITSQAHPALRVAALTFMVVLVVSNRILNYQRTTRRLDAILSADLSIPLMLISVLAIYTALQSGLASMASRELLMEQKIESASNRYFGYLLLTGGWMSVHVICTAAAQPRWTTLQKLAVLSAVAAASLTLSKAAFLPILLAFLFVYSKRIGKTRLVAAAAAGVLLTLLLTQRLFEDASLGEVATVFFERIIKNVDVLDYIEGLGPTVSLQYPHASPAYPLWPLFQLTQSDFVVPGVWFHGTYWDDWRGFGPNPTFVGDLLIASMFAGIVFAPLFGNLLRAADRSCYRVFVAMLCYQFLQDWYYSCLVTSLFLVILFTTRAIRSMSFRAHARRRHRSPHPALPAAR